MRNNYEYYKDLLNATFRQKKTSRCGPSFVLEVNELFKLKDENRIFRISRRERRILIVDTSFQEHSF